MPGESRSDRCSFAENPSPRFLSLSLLPAVPRSGNFQRGRVHGGHVEDDASLRPPQVRFVQSDFNQVIEEVSVEIGVPVEALKRRGRAPTRKALAQLGREESGLPFVRSPSG